MSWKFLNCIETRLNLIHLEDDSFINYNSALNKKKDTMEFAFFQSKQRGKRGGLLPEIIKALRTCLELSSKDLVIPIQRNAQHSKVDIKLISFF